ncbi:MAG: PAS domain S-box protein [Rhodothermales bacterium]
MSATNRNTSIPNGHRLPECEGGECTATTARPFEAVATHLPVPLVRLRPDGTLCFANEAAARLTGHATEAMVGRPLWLEITHPEDRHRLTGALRSALRQGHAETSIRFQTAGGAMRRANVRLQSEGDEMSGVFVDVTERDEMTAALLQSEMLYQTFLEQSPVGIAHLDAEGVVTFENHRLRTITGEDADAAWIGRALSEIAGFDDRLCALVMRMLAEGDPFTADDLVVMRSDGRRRIAQVYGAAIQHPEEGIIGGVLMLTDVTEEREREEELRVLQRYDQAGLALRDAALASTSEPHTFLAAAARILGETAGADCVAVLLPEEGAESFGEQARWSGASDESGTPIRFDAAVWASLSSDPTRTLPRAVAETIGGGAVVLPFTVEGKPGGMLLLTGRSDSPERWAPAERRALRRLGVLFETLWGWMLAEARYRQVVSSVEDSLFSFTFAEGGERLYSFATRQMEALTGYSTDELLSGELSWGRSVVFADDRDAVAKHEERLRAGHESRLVYRIRTAQGGVRWLRESATPGRDRTSHTVVAGILSDVTEAKEAEATLIQARQDAESATRMKSTFLATMSHEIRTPLGAISGFAELLLEEVAALPEAPPEVTEFASTIRTSTKKVLRLVNDLFDLASLQSGRMYVDRAPVALHPIVTQVTAGHKAALAERGVALDFDLAADDPIVLGEARRIEQIVEHLVSNAVKFTEAGHVRIATGVDETAVRITVEDTGIGIEPDYMADLFEPFSQEDNRLNRNYEGSGLGLAIVKRIVEAMNGTVVVASERGEGTRFDVTLPRADG